MKLATLTQLKAHIGIPAHDTSKDTKLNLLLEGSSEYIEGQCSRKFGVETHAIKLDGNGTDSLVLPQYPILMSSGDPAITVLKIDGESVLSQIEAGTIDVDAPSGVLYRTDRVWPEGRRNVQITFTAGYALPGDEESGDDRDPVPADLSLAAIRLAARVYERSMAEGVSNVSRAATNFTFKDAIDDEIKQTIKKYMKIRV